MYSPLFALIGVILIVIILVDLLSTTVHIGEGLLTKIIQFGVSKGVGALYKVWPRRFVLSWSNLFVIMSLVLFWVIVHWLGWLLIFSSSEAAVINAQTNMPADIWSRIYFSGFTVSTLGTGDYRPNGPIWQFLTAIGSLSGFFMLTFIITFIVPIAQGQYLRRKIGLYINHAGISVQELILNTWDGEKRSTLDDLLASLNSDLIEMEQRHMSMPLLHRFNSPRSRDSIALGLARLDEALTIAEYIPNLSKGTAHHIARRAIDGYIETMKNIWVAPADEAPPLPSVDQLRDKGLLTISKEELARLFEQHQERRRYLKAMIQESGWDWEMVHNQESVNQMLHMENIKHELT